MRILASAYQMGSHLEAVEADEQDPERLERLYRIDHANTRIRRHAENLQVLLGRRVEDADPQTVTLVDVVRAAASAVEYYPRIRVGHVVDLAVVEFAADDVIRVLTELLDNATRFSPPTSSVIVSAYITEDGSVLLRVEDAGVGIHPDQLPTLNALLAGRPLTPVTLDPAAHLGLAVVAHLAVAHHLRVTLTNRPSGGTTATVLVPGALLCENTAAAGPDVTGPAGSAPPAAWPPPPPAEGGRVHQWSTQMTPAQESTHAPTVRLATIGGQPTDRPDETRPTTGGGLPRRVAESVRVENPTATAHRPGTAAPHRPGPPEAGSPPEAWPDETAAFAAGVDEAQTTPNTDEGQLR